MKRIESISDEMQHVVTYELTGGKRVTLDAGAVRKYGAAKILRDCGFGSSLSSERAPVRWHGKIVGTMDQDFDPGASRSRSFLYDMRPGDFIRQGDEWIAERSLGPGDLSAVPGFRWSDDPLRAERDIEIDHEILAASLRAPSQEG